MMRAMPESPSSLQLRIDGSVTAIDALAWDALLARQPSPTPFMRHAYLAALEASGSAAARTGWTPQCFSLWRGGELAAACMLYRKTHSRGEYVFDWAWADAYARHGLAYYPKAVVAVPFTPVPGTRLMASDTPARRALLRTLLDACRAQQLPSLHLLFGDEDDLAAAEDAGLMRRETVQFHWHNRHPALGRPFTDFEDFLASLSQEKRKKIRQERRRVAQAGVCFRTLQGRQIGDADWAFFYRCYERTYLEHGNPPYLAPDFFARMQATLPEAWVLFIAERGGQPIASSLIAVSAHPASAGGIKPLEDATAYGRYWGALERVDSLHFEACYYQPLAWCIAHGARRFEGGAQGEHKLARALLPVKTGSAHWLAHPAFAHAVDEFLQHERQGVARYVDMLDAHSPYREPR